ncbi:MAG: hypothetical protein K2J85_00965, partial [Anaeroplasmataceae bacterium]|nr:hypothetical protein [Anaeroplasmataceae bacterium]
DCYNYYNNDFQMMQFLYHINDELGTILINEPDTLIVPAPTTDSPNRKLTVEAFDLAMYKSLNRLYEKNLITKKEYVDRIFRNASRNRPMVISALPSQDINKDGFIYSSNSFRAFFSIDHKYIGLARNESAKQFVTILYEEGKITKEEYDNEISLIDSVCVKHNSYNTFDFPSKVIIDYYMFSALIPFDDYQLFYCDFIIEK